MNRQKLIKKITQKKEFSQLPEKDVEKAFEHFEGRQVSYEEKVKLTRDLLRKVFSVFTSLKLLSSKNKEPEWILKKHISTQERILCYKQIYQRIFKNVKGKISVIDLGAGVNGFSYKYLENKKIIYTGVESVGQLADLQNNYFKKEKISGKVFHMSLFEIEKIKKIIRKQQGEKIVFLFKVIDSLEMLERDSSVKLLKGIVPLADMVIISFATESLVRRKKFFAQRKWILNFIRDNFRVLDDFKFCSERYIVIGKNL
jgi:hypothetical protein